MPFETSGEPAAPSGCLHYNGGTKMASYCRSSQACASRAASLQNLLGLRVGIEGLALLDADRLELIDHHLVAFEPGLALHEAVERLEEAQVVGDRAVEHDVDRIDELRRRRIGRLRERIELDPLAVGDRLGDVGVAAALQIRAQQCVARDRSPTAARCSRRAPCSL